MSEQEEEEERYNALVERARREYDQRAGEGPQIQLQLDIPTTLYLIGNIQLALRHPQNRGASAAVAREIVDGLIEAMKAQGFPAHAELASLSYVLMREREEEPVTVQ